MDTTHMQRMDRVVQSRSATVLFMLKRLANNSLLRLAKRDFLWLKTCKISTHAMQCQKICDGSALKDADKIRHTRTFFLV